MTSRSPMRPMALALPERSRFLLKRLSGHLGIASSPPRPTPGGCAAFRSAFVSRKTPHNETIPLRHPSRRSMPFSLGYLIYDRVDTQPRFAMGLRRQPPAGEHRSAADHRGGTLLRVHADSGADEVGCDGHVGSSAKTGALIGGLVGLASSLLTARHHWVVHGSKASSMRPSPGSSAGALPVPSSRSGRQGKA